MVEVLNGFVFAGSCHTQVTATLTAIITTTITITFAITITTTITNTITNTMAGHSYGARDKSDAARVALEEAVLMRRMRDELRVS